MPRGMFLSVAALFLAGAVVPAVSTAAADTMVAIVLASEGSMEPRLGMYPELKNKDEISLGVGAKLVFSHYYQV